MRPTTSKRKKRYFGMTGAQVGVLVVMSLFICGILGVGVFLVLQDSTPMSASEPNQQPLRVQPTYTPLPTYTPFPTSTPLPRFPPTWTPTPSPLSDCAAFLLWTDGAKPSLDAFKATNDELASFMASSVKPNQYDSQVVVDTFREFSTRFQNIAANLRKQDAPMKYRQIIYAWTDSVDEYSVALWNSAQAIEQKDANGIASTGQKFNDALKDVENKLEPLGSAYNQCKR